MEAPGRDILPGAGSFRHKGQQLVDSEPLLYECTESTENRGLESPTGLIFFFVKKMVMQPLGLCGRYIKGTVA